MLKRMVASLLASVGLLSLNAPATLAKPAVNFAAHETFYPSSCTIAIKGEKYGCDYTVMGAFSDASANLKLCSKRYCLILMLSPTQVANVADGEDFYVRQMAWQRGSTVSEQWDVSMQCGFKSDAMGCIGELENGSAIAIYVE
ncbi:MAG: hypothetical protein RMZ42_06495 [Nostoc sp. DedQUE05]|uniref:hypothetical protein n=1 Tax=Nostoc sp. DedQUE05 TaxID=3075391 RepID=UPI002AD532B5|nr:hypothetical protein [Nostoc sp. DedQUE05]MDZ8091573.1 hypothetical protein [Nostoc sp. DedQUE05]